MIKSVTATNYLGESLTFELGRPDETGIYVRSIDGLGPVAATINTTELSSSDGSVFNSARLNQRNIVMNFGLMFNPMIEDMRHKLYRFFPLKKPVRIDVITDRRECYAIGYVETNNPDIFSKEETQQISIVCPSPWLYGIDEAQQSVNMFSVTANLEFPFPHDSWEDDAIEFGIINNEPRTPIDYYGDDDVGLIMEMHFTTSINCKISILDELKNMSMTFDVANSSFSSFSNGDTLYISTVKGDKYVRVMRVNGTQLQNGINILSRDSDWLYLTNGNNIFSVAAENDAVEPYIQTRIRYNTLYTGV